MKCHKVWRACLKMSQIWKLVVHGSEKGCSEIREESGKTLLKFATSKSFCVVLTFLVIKGPFWLEIQFGIETH